MQSPSWSLVASSRSKLGILLLSVQFQLNVTAVTMITQSCTTFGGHAAAGFDYYFIWGGGGELPLLCHAKISSSLGQFYNEML